MPFDVIIVGSGFGGAIVGCRLAEAGLKVLILERGRRWDAARSEDLGIWKANYPREPSDPWVFDNVAPERNSGWVDFRHFENVSVVAGAGVGGGSLIYANVFTTPPALVFNQGWPQEISFNELKPYFDAAAQFVNAQKIPTGFKTRRELLMESAAHSLGEHERLRPLELTVSFDPAFQGPCFATKSKDFLNSQGVLQGTCVYLGECGIGCPVNAKNNLATNYIPWAEKHGAQIRPLHLVSSIEKENSGYRVFFEQLFPEKSMRKRGSETARMVVLAAGSLNSTELLLKCRDVARTLPNLSPFLGRNWSSNGFLFIPTFYKHETLPSNGPTISSALDFLDGSQGGQSFWIEDGGFPEILLDYLEAWALGGHPRNELEAQAQISARKLWECITKDDLLNSENDFRSEIGLPLPKASRMMPFMAQGIDPGNGVARLKRGRLDIHWDLKQTYPLFDAILATLQRILETSGGSGAVVPFRNSPIRHQITAHPLGGCNMGTRPSDGVVDHSGKVFGYDNLYVADGAVVPRPLGVNPSRTIAALAERIAKMIISEEGRERNLSTANKAYKPDTSKVGRTVGVSVRDSKRRKPPVSPDPPRSAYALLRCDETVLADHEFPVVVGLAPDPDPRIAEDQELTRPASSIGPYRTRGANHCRGIYFEKRREMAS